MAFTWQSMVEALVAIATPVGVFLAYWQLRQSRLQAIASFEDALSAQYRALLAEIPVDALLGRTLEREVQVRSISAFYRYFDLSNEQAFLRTRNRIGEATWADWAEGIRQNMDLPAFQVAWAEIRGAGTGCFDDLARLVGDPRRIERSEAA